MEISKTSSGRPVSWHPGADIAGAVAADIVVNTTNSVGVMGKGVALALKNAYPAHFEAYRRDCARRLVFPGSVILYPRGDSRYIASLATKNHWRDPSREEWVDAGLKRLAVEARRVGANSIALPPPGCGLGGLSWERIQPLVLDYLKDFELKIYASPARSVGQDAVAQNGVGSFSTLVEAGVPQGSFVQPAIGTDRLKQVLLARQAANARGR